MASKIELSLLSKTLNALFWSVEDETCAHVCVIAFHANNLADPLVVLQYPENEREQFREKLVAIINVRMGDS